MGLDMYLMRRTKDTTEAGDEVYYWRKANQIRQWFVNHTALNNDDNQKDIVLTQNDIKLLIADCMIVSTIDKTLHSPVMAKELLPTSNGFFFGSTDYDDYYYEVVSATLTDLIKLYYEFDWENDDLIYTEWW